MHDARRGLPACLPARPACSSQGAWTQLHAACLAGHLEAVKALLEAGNQRMLSPLEVKRRLVSKAHGHSLALRHEFMARSSLARNVDGAGTFRIVLANRTSLLFVSCLFAVCSPFARHVAAALLSCCLLVCYLLFLACCLLLARCLTRMLIFPVSWMFYDGRPRAR